MKKKDDDSSDISYSFDDFFILFKSLTQKKGRMQQKILHSSFILETQ